MISYSLARVHHLWADGGGVVVGLTDGSQSNCSNNNIFWQGFLHLWADGGGAVVGLADGLQSNCSNYDIHWQGFISHHIWADGGGVVVGLTDGSQSNCSNNNIFWQGFLHLWADGGGAVVGLTDGSQRRQRSKTAVTKCRTVAPAVARSNKVGEMINPSGYIQLVILFRCLGYETILSRPGAARWK